jgi:hypothetical protein
MNGCYHQYSQHMASMGTDTLPLKFSIRGDELNTLFQGLSHFRASEWFYSRNSYGSHL